MRKSFFLIAILLQAWTSMSATIQSSQDGPWNDPNTWDCTCIPTSIDDVTLYHDVISAVDQEIGTLTFGTTWYPSTSSGTLDITAGTVTVNGTVTFGVNGQTNGMLTIRSGAKFVSTGTISWQQGSVINVYGELEGTSFSVTNGGGGNFNIYSGGSVSFTNDITLSAGNHSFNIQGNMTVGGDVSISGSAGASVDGSLQIDGHLDIAADGNKITGSGTVTAATAECPGDDCGIGTEEEVLPVTLKFFDLSQSDTEIIISWQTVSELNNDHFNLYRSLDGINFDLITIVQGNGTTNEVMNYSFVDKMITPGIVYYQLEQVDYDGQNEYFPAKSIVSEKLVNLSVYPNPCAVNADLNVSLSFVSKDQTEINLIDISSRSRQKLDYEVFGNQLKLNTAELGLSKGIYLIEVNTPQKRFVEKIILH